MKKYWKIIVLLAIVIILYLAGTGLGLRQSQSDEESPSSDEDFKDQSVGEWLDESLPAWAQNLKLIPRPKVKIEEMKLEGSQVPLKSPKITLKASKTATFLIATSEDEYRDATFTVGNCSFLAITYRTLNGKGDDLKKQQWPDPGRKSDPEKASFTVLQYTGELQFKNSGESDCTVTLE